MDYELAKELKDAGFPQSIQEGHNYACCATGEEKHNECLTCAYIPTLDELIDACGDCLSHIKKWNGVWWAVSHCGHEEHEPGGNNLEMNALVPRTALARLYLALNPRQKEPSAEAEG